MKINIDEKYKKNILGKYDFSNRAKFETDFTPKEQNMWNFVLMLLKQNIDKVIYDSNNDKDYLTGFLSIYLTWKKKDEFTIDEWFDYLNKK